MSGACEPAESFLCQRCNILYRSRREETSRPIAGRFACIDCNEDVHQWSAHYDYPKWLALNWTGWLERRPRRWTGGL